ncbi:N-acetylmuramoyl-L-alanine amidase family protein [Flavobacterium rhizosphaerae]|uniref:N-acetylmuramoyl-L-alanine amidase n=1 Tax=Flavobacterium rhizosphaerae TaxID=3163298 RepID=A0ABW8YT49_9FLAO
MKGNIRLKLFFLFFITFSGISQAQNKKFNVVLDPGHGGKDYGAIYHGFKEKTIVLSVALKVGKLLEKDNNINVEYTRKTDVFIELDDRCTIANKADADIFVSIHCNGEPKKTAYGTETFIMGMSKNASHLAVAKKENSVINLENDKRKYGGFDPDKPESLIAITIQHEDHIMKSIELAGRVQNNIIKTLNRKDRKVKQAPFWVLHRTAMPSILIELGFISYKPEGEYLDSEAGQDELAASIAKAILEYKKEYYIVGAGAVVQPMVSVAEKPQAQVIEQAPATRVATVANGIIYKVQISAGSSKLELTPSNFKGLNDISKDESSLPTIKYFYGATNDYNRAKGELLEAARSKGYKEAFVVAFKDGKKISIQEALSLGKN